MPQRRKLSDKRVLEILDAPGTLAAIARQYRVSSATVSNIKKGRRTPRSARPQKTKPATFRTPVGTVVTAQVTAMKHGRYLIKVRFSAKDADGLIGQISSVQQARLSQIANKPWAFESTHKPFEVDPDGGAVFTFKTGEYFEDKLKLTTLDGNKLRKPDAIVAGRKVVVTYRPVAWDRANSHRGEYEADVKYPGVGVILSLLEVALLRQRTHKS